jgi:predicted dehydrogenase
VIQSYVLGSGAASQAIQKALGILDVLYPSWGIKKPILIKREVKLDTLKPVDKSVLFLANPHALHTPRILEAERAGFKWVLTEKPAAVSVEQIEELNLVKIPVAVFHGYRQTWGIQTLKKYIDQGELGEWGTLEGRYWQASAGEKRLLRESSDSWKDQKELSGAFDVLLDLGTHWADLVFFLLGIPVKGKVWISYLNSMAEHRDTTNFIEMDYGKNKKAFGSVSKNVHGSGNDLELVINGEKKSMKWNLARPDELAVGEGSKTTVLQRSTQTMGSQQWPFHGTGWLEGYIEIIKQYFHQMRGESFDSYPNLREQITVLKFLLKSASQE